MPNTKPLMISAADFEEKQRRAAATSWCDYAFYIGGSAVTASQLAELEQLPGCAGVKVFMGSSFGDLLCDDREVLRTIPKHGFDAPCCTAARPTWATAWGRTAHRCCCWIDSHAWM
jgi:dihydroorotase